VNRLLKPVVALVLLGTAGVSTVACSTDSTDTGTAYSVAVTLDTAEAPVLVINEVGVNKEHRYGEAQLVGKAELAGEQVDVEVLAIVNYLDGNGPFEGFWTFTAGNGDRLALSYSGEAEQRDGRGQLRGTVKVLGGTGRYAKVTGSGTVEGKRSGEFRSGTAIAYLVTLHLSGVS
jgi:hypothetical protein